MFEGELNDLRSQLKVGEQEKIKLSEQVSWSKGGI